MQAKGAKDCRFAIAVVAVLCLGGCAQWKDASSSSPLDHVSTGQPQDQRHRVILDVSFVNLPLDSMEVDQVTGLWQWVDETPFDVALRQRLLDNGIRVGIVRNEERFRDELESFATPPDVVDEFLNQASVASDVSHGDQQIPIRLGRRYELALRQPFEGSHVTLIRADGDPIGRTLNNAQYFLALTASQSEQAQQIRLQMLPEIQYGAARQKWVSSDTAIRIDTRRETWSLTMLGIDLNVSEGDLIVVAPDSPLRGLASKMLTGNGTDQHEQQLLVLIQIAQIPSPADQIGR